MAFELALKLGCTLAELDRRLSIREWHRWRDYYARRPWCAEGSFHIPLAYLSQMFASANKGKTSVAPKLIDFLPYREKVEPDIDAQLLGSGW